jgi:hypothetical protein
LEAECLRLGYLPSRAYGYSTCADKWKLDPFNWWTRKQWPTDAIDRAIGFDADEAGRVTADGIDKGFTKVYPLIAWGWAREECVAAIARAGLPVPVKSACFFCPSSTKTEVLALAQSHPLLFRRAIEMESIALANGKTTTVKGLGRHWSWKELADADAATRDAMAETPVESCSSCHVAS